MRQSPGHGHRELALVADVCSWTEKIEGPLVAALSREQHHARASRGVELVPLSGLAVGTCNGLVLPVNEVPADRVVAIAGGRREVSTRLVQREREKIRLLFVGPIHA